MTTKYFDNSGSQNTSQGDNHHYAIEEDLSGNSATYRETHAKYYWHLE